MAKQPQLPPHRATAVDALRAMKIPKAQALEHVNAVPGDTLEEVVKNALARHGALRSGQPVPDFGKVSPPVPPNAVRVAPSASQYQQTAAGLQRRLSPEEEQALERGVRERYAAYMAGATSAPRAPLLQRIMGGLRGPATSGPAVPGMIAPTVGPTVQPTTPAQQQTIPGFAPPGGPAAAPQPSALRSLVPQAPIASGAPAATPVPKPVIRVRAAGQRMPSAPIAQPPTKEAQPPTKEAEPPSKAARPISISTEKEYNNLPPGTDFIWGAHVWTKPK